MEPFVTTTPTASKSMRGVGEFFVVAFDAMMLIPRRLFVWREFAFHTWLVARVSLLPTMMLSIPFTTLVAFMLFPPHRRTFG